MKQVLSSIGKQLEIAKIRLGKANTVLDKYAKYNIPLVHLSLKKREIFVKASYEYTKYGKIVTDLTIAFNAIARVIELQKS